MEEKMTQKQDKLKEKLEELWRKNHLPGWSSKRLYEMNVVWRFVQQALQAERRKVVKEIKKMKDKKVNILPRMDGTANTVEDLKYGRNNR